MIFEQPASCLNPVFTIGDQIAEAVRIKENCSKKASWDRAVELMKTAGIPSAKERCRQYPHEFSGGMIQRAMIAMALAFRPSLLIADEPTTSLDVTIQAQITRLLSNLVAEFGMSLLLITHDLGVASRLCETIAVMYAGEIVEKGPIEKILKNPDHPYTQALTSAVSEKERPAVKGSVPELSRLPDGCRFHPRCPRADNLCRDVKPIMKNNVRCHFADTIESTAVA
jgi:oligopeptide/dipeptide ABC transporter ATP-binding protein